MNQSLVVKIQEWMKGNHFASDLEESSKGYVCWRWKPCPGASVSISIVNPETHLAMFEIEMTLWGTKPHLRNQIVKWLDEKNNTMALPFRIEIGSVGKVIVRYSRSCDSISSSEFTSLLSEIEPLSSSLIKELFNRFGTIPPTSTRMPSGWRE